MAINQFSISFKHAEKLLADPFSCLKRVTVHEHLRILPRYLTAENKINVSAAIKDTYSNALYFYSKKFLGVPLSYGNIKCYNAFGTILDESPEMHLDINIDFIVFQPKIGQQCKGVVNKISPNHIGVLIHNCFNAALQSNKSQVIQIGDEVRFVVSGVQAYKRIFNIRGQLSSKDFILRSHKDRRKVDINVGNLNKNQIRSRIRNTAQEAMQYFNYLSKNRPIKSSEFNTYNGQPIKSSEVNTHSNDENISTDLQDSVTPYKENKSKNKKSLPSAEGIIADDISFNINGNKNLGKGNKSRRNKTPIFEANDDQINSSNISLISTASTVQTSKHDNNASSLYSISATPNYQPINERGINDSLVDSVTLSDDDSKHILKTKHSKRNRESINMIPSTDELPASETTKHRKRKSKDASDVVHIEIIPDNLRDLSMDDANLFLTSTLVTKHKSRESLADDARATTPRRRLASTSSSRDDSSSVVVTQHIQPRRRKKRRSDVAPDDAVQNGGAYGDEQRGRGVKVEKFASPPPPPIVVSPIDGGIATTGSPNRGLVATGSTGLSSPTVDGRHRSKRKKYPTTPMANAFEAPLSDDSIRIGDVGLSTFLRPSQVPQKKKHKAEKTTPEYSSANSIWNVSVGTDRLTDVSTATDRLTGTSWLEEMPSGGISDLTGGYTRPGMGGGDGSSLLDVVKSEKKKKRRKDRSPTISISDHSLLDSVNDDSNVFKTKKHKHKNF